MRKSNDTTKTRELTEAELAAVSGGDFEIKDFSFKMFHGTGGDGERFLKIGGAEAAGF